ncbi:MAG: mannose-1-phosphate guanylyltransferase [candidate division KSB1 bacterium]|nr:mannose-1-phosphate guanylyltransferase [candidate division KSB1 bacterium]
MYVLIMAGGVGTRFWPRSREKFPKQLLSIVDDKTMIQSTVARLGDLASRDNLYVVTTGAQVEGIRAQLPFLKAENIIIEPKGKNTAPCIGLSALFMKRTDPEGIMVVLPADHLIQEEEKFRSVITTGIKIVQEKDCLVTIGIHPTYPATGYGYIQYDGKLEGNYKIPAYKVKTFAEKPDIRTAERFLASGDFLWNSGIFIWKIKTILQEIEEALPELYDGLVEIDQALGKPNQDEVIHRVYCQIRGISIDYGVMEQAKNVVVLEGKFGWNDIGSWEEVYKISHKDEYGNAFKGNHVLKETTGCLIAGLVN